MYIQTISFNHAKRQLGRIGRFYEFCDENNVSLNHEDNDAIIARLIEFYNLDISIDKDRDDIEFFRVALMF